MRVEMKQKKNSCFLSLYLDDLLSILASIDKPKNPLDLT